MGQIGFASGFAFQSSFGRGNYEVFLPWPGGGFAHYWYDYMWRGPVLFGAGTAISVAVWESEWRHFDNDHGNFELLALVQDSGSRHLVQWWRQNGPPFAWQFHQRLPGSEGSVGLAFGKQPIHNEGEKQRFYAFGARHNEGLRMHDRNTSSLQWTTGVAMRELGPNDSEYGSGSVPITRRYMALGWVHGTVGSGRVTFSELAGRSALVGTLPNGVVIFQEAVFGMGGPGVTLPQTRRWYRPQRIGDGAVGRPCIIQTDRGYSEPLIGPSRHGNYEVFVPAERGGFLHFWRDNNGSGVNQWKFAASIGTEQYDEVAAFQDRDMRVGDATGRVHVFAWQRGEPWLHHYVQNHRTDHGFQWDAPETIGTRPVTPQEPELWIISCVTTGVFRDGTRRWVKRVGGVRNGQPWSMSAAQVIEDIRQGRKRFVSVGPSGRPAPVQVVDDLDADEGVFHPYLTTGMDGVADNNLLNLPQCP